QSRSVRQPLRNAHHQPAPAGDSGSRHHRKAPEGPGGFHRHPDDGVPGHRVRSPDHRRGRGGPVHEPHQEDPGGFRSQAGLARARAEDPLLSALSSAFTAFLAVAVPLLAALSARRLRGSEISTRALYASALVYQWILALLTYAALRFDGEGPGDIGFQPL